MPIPHSESAEQERYLRAFFARMAIAILHERRTNGDDAIERFIQEQTISLTQHLQTSIAQLAEAGDDVQETVAQLRAVVDDVAALEMSPVVPGLQNTTVLKRLLTSRLTQTIQDTVVVPRDATTIDTKAIDAMMKRLDHFRLIFFDVNGLKVANDIGTHADGDKVLQNFGLVAQTVAAGSEGDRFHVFHKSGDEFIVFCEDCTQGTVDDFIERVQKEYAQHDLIDDILDTDDPTVRRRLARVIASIDGDGGDQDLSEEAIEKHIASAPAVPLAAAAGTATVAQMMVKAANRLADNHGSGLSAAITAEASDLLPAGPDRKSEDLYDLIDKFAGRLINIADEEMQSAKEAMKRAAAEEHPRAAAILSFGRGAESVTKEQKAQMLEVLDDMHSTLRDTITTFAATTATAPKIIRSSLRQLRLMTSQIQHLHRLIEEM